MGWPYDGTECFEVDFPKLENGLFGLKCILVGSLLEGVSKGYFVIVCVCEHAPAHACGGACVLFHDHPFVLKTTKFSSMIYKSIRSFLL